MGFILIWNSLISHTIIPVNPVNFLIYINIIQSEIKTIWKELIFSTAAKFKIFYCDDGL